MFGLKKKKPARISLLDGPLSPNDLLEQAASLQVNEPDDLCIAPDGSLLVSSGNSILRLKDWGKGSLEPVAEFDHEIIALACREDGLIAVGLAGAGVRVITQQGKVGSGFDGAEKSAEEVRACAFAKDGALLIADAGTKDGEASFLQGLYDKTGMGRVIKFSEGGKSNILADSLRFPYGLVETGAGEVMVCESWAARICQLENGASEKSVLQDAPGYPARIHPLSGGGYILSLFSRRDPLIEFVLTEPEFMERMKTEIDPKYWIAPRLAATADYRVPIQMGATRLFGEIKPWAPSFSYGLIIILDEYFTPLASAQSRANGKRHGITSALAWQGDLIAVSKGSNELLKVTAMDQLI